MLRLATFSDISDLRFEAVEMYKNIQICGNNSSLPRNEGKLERLQHEGIS
jgi:hypothetical protein